MTPGDNHCECTEIMTSTTTIFSGFYARSSFTLDTKNMFGPINLHWQKKKQWHSELPTCSLLYDCVSILCTANTGSLYLCWVHKGHLVRKNHNMLKQHKISNLILKWKILSDLFFENVLLPFILACVNVSRPTGISYNLFLPIWNTLTEETKEVYMDIYMATQ